MQPGQRYTYSLHAYGQVNTSAQVQVRMLWQDEAFGDTLAR